MKEVKRLVRACLTGGLLATMLSTAPAMAAHIVFDNGSPNAVGAFLSDPTSGVATNYHADDFMFAADTLVGDMTFYGVYVGSNTPTTNNVTINFFNDNGAGLPDGSAAIASYALGNAAAVDTNMNLGGFDIYSITVNFTPITFLASTTYWVSALNDLATDDWYWATTANPGAGSNGAAGSTDNVNWALQFSGNQEWELAFQLSGGHPPPPPGPQPVPEPATLGLLGLGLAGLGLTRRRKKS